MAQAIIHHYIHHPIHHLLRCLFVLILLLFVQATTVTPTDRGFTVELIHRYSERSPFYDGNLTQSQLIHRLIKLSISRVQWLESTNLGANVTTLRPLLESDGRIYMVAVAIGTDQGRRYYHLQLDTGSELSWTPCKPCEPCFGQPNPRFDPHRSPTYKSLSGNHHLCAPPYKPNGSGKCTFKIVYGDQSSSQGILSQDTFTFQSDIQGKFETVGMVFGCAHSATFSGRGDRGIDGIMGMGSGPLSLPTQLGHSIDGHFSYCLVPMLRSRGARNSGFLRFGRRMDHLTGTIKSTRIITYDGIPLYYLQLEDVSINGRRLNLPPETFAVRRDRSGGCIIDSGAAITHLIKPAYDEVRNTLTGLFRDLQLPRVTIRGPLELCYRTPKNNQKLLPHMTLHFRGADYHIGSENLFFNDHDDIFCWAMVATDLLTTLGVHQQYNVRFLYDIQGRMLSFAPENCAESHH